MLTDQAEKYMKVCDYFWVRACRHQKQQATQILEGLKLQADNLRGVVETLRMCRMIIEGVEPNTLQTIQTMRGLLPREVADVVSPQAHIWNATTDQPNLDKFLAVVHYALVAKAPAVTYTQRQALGIQQAAVNLESKVAEEDRAAVTAMQQIAAGIVAAVQQTNKSQAGRIHEGGKEKSSKKIPEWILTEGRCYQSGGTFKKGRACCKQLVNSQTTRLYSGVVFAKASVSQDNLRNIQASVDWLVDLGSPVTGIRADLPGADTIRWSRPSVKLIAAK